MIGSSVASAQPLSQFLRMAVIAGVETAVQIHIERGDNLNARDANGMTPLMLCAARNKPAICKLLLSAGADHGLLDPSGKTALEIAIAAGSDAAVAILSAASASITFIHPAKTTLDAGPSKPSEPHNPISEAAMPVEPGAATVPTEPQTLAEQPAQEPRAGQDAVVDEMEFGEFDLSDWEAEEEATRPEFDSAIVDSASAVQIAITAHEPIDSSAEWDDIVAYLPEMALPLARSDDAEGRARLRRLLLRAFREGSVPALDVQAQSTNEDRSANPDAEAYLAMVINDLGAEVDERFEYSDTDESFEVFVDPQETPDEEAALDEALVAIDRAASRRHEPLRLYLREFQRHRLLTAEEEIRLAKDMEAALDAALDALATWPVGITRTLAAGAEAVAGTRQLSSIWVGAEPDPESATTEHHEAGESTRSEPDDAIDNDSKPANETSSATGDAIFADALRRLAALVEREEGPRVSVQEIRQTLADMRINRRFLLELVDAAHGPAPCSAFIRAMADFQKARDRMASANLKLAFFHAKKYLNSGEPLDDLAQEGNIGLLKAVDRYDWRRGFRFSTYATWWIRQQISRYVADKVRTIRVPVHVHEKLQRMERLAKTFETTVGREPTLDELTKSMEIPPHKLVTLQRIAPEPSPIDELTIDSMIAIDARDTFASPDPADVVSEIQLNEAVDRYISSLSTTNRKEERILRLRFGIGVDEEWTLDEIGRAFEVSRERIRQIEAQAIKKLRHPCRSDPFARLVLGLKPEEEPGAAGTQTPHRDENRSPVKADHTPAATQPLIASIQTRSNSKLMALERVLAQAAELGIQVEDGRSTPSGRIWVNLVDIPDDQHRRLAIKLIQFGFNQSPGKGFWR